MIKDVVLGTMTMNAGKGIPGSTIRWALKNQFREFQRVIVVDGDLTDEAKAFYGQFSNVEIIDSPWKDSYVAQYQKFADRLDQNQWGLWLDDDEICSPELLAALASKPPTTSLPVDIIKIPCVLYLTENNRDFYPAEPRPKKFFEGQWTKQIIFKKTHDLNFRFFGSHVIPEGKYQADYLSLPYYHMKSLESFVYNDVWQAFLHPEGQGYTKEEAIRFKMFTRCYKTSREFKNATKAGTWPPTLKKFAWEHRKDYNRPISRLAWTYFILEGHLMPEKDENMTWKDVKKHVLSRETMRLYEANKAENKGIIVENE